MRLIDADATISRLRADESFICVGDKNKAIQDVMDMPSVMPNEETEHSEKRKPCINYEDGCEEWAGCPCVYYKAKERKKNERHNGTKMD